MSTPASTPLTPTPDPATPGEELRALFVEKIAAEHRRLAAEHIEDSPEGFARRFASRVMELVYSVDDDWDAHDITTYGDLPGSCTLDQRWLVARIPRESRVRHLAPDRTVTP